MKQIRISSLYETRQMPAILFGCSLVAVLVSYLTFRYGMLMPVFFIGVSLLSFLLCFFFVKPKGTLFFLITYCFCFGILGREVEGPIPYGTLIEGISLIGLLVIIFKAYRNDFKGLNNELIFLWVGWFIISVLQVFNPSGASTEGWMQEFRSAALYPLLIIFLGFMLFRTNKDLNSFLYIIIALSLLAALNGIKQLYIGPSPGEQRFLDAGGAITHVLWGRLRVFSFYSDAGQFGASQAHIGLIALVLAFGPFKWWKRILLMVAAGVLFYGMLISGTRGALFALVIGALMAIILSKQFKILIFGGILLAGFLVFLKYTHIGNGNYEIYRLRTALNPDDASLHVRFNTQKLLKNYMSSRPFGDGLGVIGANGNKYNSNMFISTVQPDSYFVKIWAMYGVVGLTIWLGIMMYILGKCCGIVWKVKNQALRVKLIALTAGFAGILFCSYGNEVINTMPSSIVVYISWVFVFIAPKLEHDMATDKSLTP